MLTKYYDFKTQRSLGKQGEQIIDQWLQSNYKVTDVSAIARYQEIGIDRIIERQDGTSATVEYKYDMAAKRTGNIFFETVAVDIKNIPGWGWTSQADYWIFLIPQQEIIIIQPGNLRSLVWQKHLLLTERTVPNKNYKTLGIPVPLSDVRKIAYQIQKLYLEGL
ncbi:hypothetical protein [Anabaena sp. PCC 7108]|uniref:hypothetical protein n=1 Tax=Anabaena sp. PCC 7108 TaxID=163908 RepID=UPI000346C802|nr:hypothetical protein [Anabaena sp. PCC 7108]